MDLLSARISSLHLNKYFTDKSVPIHNKMYDVKVAFSDIEFNNYKLSQTEKEAIKVIKSVTAGMVVINSSFMDYLHSCDVKDNIKYRNWVYGWKVMYKTLTDLIREFKILRKEKYYTGVKTNLKLVPELMALNIDFSIDLMAMFKKTLSELATMMLVARENMKMAYNYVHPRRVKKHINTVKETEVTV